MSVVANTGVIAEFCLQTQGTLDKNPTSPEKIKQEAGMLGLVTSKRNTAAWDYKIVGGKEAPTQAGPVEAWLNYDIPFCKGGATVADDSVCSTGDLTADTRKYLKLEINKEYNRKFTMKLDEFKDVCIGFGERKIDTFRRKAYEILHEINEDLIAEYYSLLDLYPSGLAPTGETIDEVTIVNTDGHIIPAGYTKIMSTYRKAQWGGSVEVVGGDMLATYFDVQALGGRSVDRGDALKEAWSYGKMNFTYDLELDTKIGVLETTTDSYGLVFPTGSFGVIEYYRNEGDRTLIMDDFALTNIVIDGMKFDLDINVDKCGLDNRPTFTFLIRKELGVVNIPAAEYCSGKGFKHMYKFACGTPACSDFVSA